MDSADVRFEPGATVLRRYWRGDRISYMKTMTVVADDERGLRLWQPAGTTYWRVMFSDGRTHHEVTMDELAGAELAPLPWRGAHIMVWIPPVQPTWAAHTVWWFFDAGTGEFGGWYGNLEEPSVRWRDTGPDGAPVAGVDSADQALDLRISPDRSWSWKDTGEFESRIGHPLYWTAAQAAEIRAEGERLAKVAESGQFPFDGTWCDFRPEPGWPAPYRPDGWNRPRARAAARR